MSKLLDDKLAALDVIELDCAVEELDEVHLMLDPSPGKLRAVFKVKRDDVIDRVVIADGRERVALRRSAAIVSIKPMLVDDLLRSLVVVYDVKCDTEDTITGCPMFVARGVPRDIALDEAKEHGDVTGHSVRLIER